MRLYIIWADASSRHELCAARVAACASCQAKKFEQAACRIKPSSTSASRAPNESSSGTDASNECIWKRSRWSVPSRRSVPSSDARMFSGPSPTRPRRVRGTRPCWRARRRRDSPRRDARGCAPTLPRRRCSPCRRSCRPRPRYAWTISAAACSSHPQFGVPKFMAPRQIGATRIPVRPRSVSSMFTALCARRPSRSGRAARGGGRRGHRRGRESCDGGGTTNVRRRARIRRGTDRR